MFSLVDTDHNRQSIFLKVAYTKKGKAEKKALDYYAFGMGLNGRTYSAAGYKFGFNGKEKVDEVSGAGNHNTALFWEYDTRLGRRWNLAPKAQITLSDYAVMACNPIRFMDPLGDIFGVGKNKESQVDVKSIAKKKNQDYIKFGEDGSARLDFGNLSQKKADKILKNDKGLSLIKNLIDAKDEKGADEKYYYETSNRREFFVNDKYFNQDLNVKSGQETTTKEFVSNTSLTPPGDKYLHAKPPQGLNAAVFISPGTMYDLGEGQSHVVIPRSELVLHELSESYGRTHFKQNYDKAHAAAHGHGEFIKFIFR
jgi:hypothetical protein